MRYFRFFILAILLVGPNLFTQGAKAGTVTPERVKVPAAVSWMGVSEEKKRYYPMLFLIDQKFPGAGGYVARERDKARGTVKMGITLDSMFSKVLDMIPKARVAMIVSKRLACGVRMLARDGQWTKNFYTQRVRKKRDALRDIDFAQFRAAVADLWNVYAVPDTQFVLWIPKQATEYFGELFRLNEHNKLSSDNDWKQHCPEEQVLWRDPRLRLNPYQVGDLKKIFKPKEKQPLDAMLLVTISGHGGGRFCKASMAGLPVLGPGQKSISSLLSFLSTEVPTRIVYVRSCSAGGSNIDWLKGIEKGPTLGMMPLNYNYILVVGAISDQPTRISSDFAAMTEGYFTAAAQLSGKGKALDSLLAGLFRRGAEGVAGGYASFPQVWLPGTYGFYAPNISKEVLIAGNVLVGALEQEGQRLVIKDKRVVLWYPERVEVPVEIFPFVMSEQKEHTSVRVKQGLLYSRMTFVVTEHKQDPDPQTLGGAEASSGVRLSYPVFVLMRGNRSEKHIWFKEIVLPNSGNRSVGVMQFMADAFAGVVGKTDQKVIFIDKLSGNNDFPVYLGRALAIAKQRAMPGISEHRMYQEVVADLENLLEGLAKDQQKNDNVTLWDIMIILDTGQKRIEIHFMHGDFYWRYYIATSDTLSPTITGAQSKASSPWWIIQKRRPQAYSALEVRKKRLLSEGIKPELSQKRLEQILRQEKPEVLLRSLQLLRERQKAQQGDPQR